MFRVIVAGGRHYNDYYALRKFCDKVLSRKIASGEEVVIVSGHCYGVDLMGERYARDRKLGCEIYEAEWSRYGPAAGPRRNRQMAERADALIAVWDGESRGTGNMIAVAAEKGLQIRVMRYDK